MTAAQLMARQAQSEYNRLMRERIQQGSQRIRRLTARLRFGLKQCIKAMRRGWLKLNSINLPLSPIQWILLFYILLGIGYMTAAPVFEANDEIWHFGYLQHLRQTGSLPHQQPDSPEQTLYRQHGSQPPLYYALMGPPDIPLPH